MATGKIPGGLTLRIGLDSMIKWYAAWNQYPKVAGKWAAKMMNDIAFCFRARFPEVIASQYTVRNKNFIKNAIRINLAKPGRRISDIKVVFGTWLGTALDSNFDNNNGISRGEGSIRFSGFSEELTGKRGVARPHWRTILPAGRKGGTMAGIAFDWARLHANQHIPSIEDPRLQNIPEDRRFAAMIDMMTRGKMEHSPSNVFILEGGKYKRGLYRFKGGKLPDRKEFKKGNKRRVKGKGKVQRIQAFGNKSKPIMPPMWDWKALTLEKVHEKFTPDYMFKNYIEKVFTGMTPKEFFKGK
jgi:hypothetical protein